MTTAHRPTWKAAVGRSDEGGFGLPSAVKAVRDERAHTKLKLRAQLQGNLTREEKLRIAKEKLEEAEKNIRKQLVPKPRVIDLEEEKKLEMKLLANHAASEERECDTGKKLLDEEALKAKGYDDADDDGGSEEGGGGGWSDVDNDDSDDDLSESSSDEDDLDESDEEAALQAELDKIRKEREIQKAKEDAIKANEEEAQMEEAALIGNPLLGNDAVSGKVKRKWNDDVPFRNQARGEPERNKKRFINDTVRNDFHKKFLNKFIR